MITDQELMDGIVDALDEIRVIMLQTEREIKELKRRNELRKQEKSNERS